MAVHYKFNRPDMPKNSSKEHRLWNLSTAAGIITCLLICLICVGIATAWSANKGFPSARFPAGASGITGQANADTVSEGDTRLFYAFAQGFFTGYYPLSVTCQMVGDKAYLFTEDAYINDITASSIDTLILFAAAEGGFFKSIDGGLTWTASATGLPDADGAFGSFDSTNFNHRCRMLAAFTRAEYGETSDTVWAGTEYGIFWSTSEGNSFGQRMSGMNQDPETGDKPTTYDILGHPTNTRTLWSATEDGVYMTRNANRWKPLSAGLPLGEGSIWPANPASAIQYDETNDLVFVCSSKGIFYGTTRALFETVYSEIVTSWKPLGGLVSFTLDSVFTDTVWLDSVTVDAIYQNGYVTVEETTSLGMIIAPGQNITLVDTVRNIYWATLVDQAVEGLFAVINDTLIFCYPDTSVPPTVDYDSLAANDTTLVAYGYSQITGPSILLDGGDDEMTVWLAAEDGGLYSYQISGDIADKYFTDQVTISSSHDDMTIYKIAWRESDSTYYFATDQGLYRAADPHGDWTRLTGHVMNNDATDSLIVDARTVAVGPDDYIYTGGYMGGFLRAPDGENFTPSNLGLIHRLGTPNQLSLFLDEFEDTTPAPDDSGGIYDVVQEWWGDLPPADSPDDVDGDEKVVILFLDIDDQYYLDTGDGTYISGYYDGINEYSRLYFTQSNQAEMFYLDTDPGWINRAGAAACNQTFNLINWNQDFEEEVWLREGLTSFSQHVAGYPMATGTITFQVTNSLTAWGDYNRDTEHMYSFLLMLYLYEQIFEDEDQGGETVHTISEIATSPYHGVEGLGRLIYEAANPDSLSSDNVDYTPYFASRFEDFIVACALDITDTNFHDGKYGFTAETVSVNAITKNWYYVATGVTPPPYSSQVPFWSVSQVLQIKDVGFFNSEHPIVEVQINGDDRNRLSYYLLFSDVANFTPGMNPDLVTVIKAPTDSVQQKGNLVLPPELHLLGNSDPPNNLRVLAVCTSALEEAPSCYVFGDDLEPPDSISMTVAQNPIDNNYMDIYTFTPERLFPDGAQLYRVDNLTLTYLEGPEVDITGGSEVITLDQEVFYSNLEASDFVYHIAYHLEGLDLADELLFTAYGEDASGNEIASNNIPVTVDFIENLAGGTLYLSGSGVCLTIPPQALVEDAYVLLSVSQYPTDPIPETSAKLVAAQVDPVHTAVGPLVSAGSAGMDLSAPIALQVPYDPDLAANADVGVYRAEGDGWVYVGGTPGYDEGVLETYSWKFGQFQVFSGPLGDMKPEMPYKFTLDQNYPNPFNPATRIQFELTRSQQVTVDIFNIMGKRVAQIDDGPFQAGRHVLYWNANNLSSGVYFLRLKAEEGILYRKMMLLK